jgi:hypothetical protein
MWVCFFGGGGGGRREIGGHTGMCVYVGQPHSTTACIMYGLKQNHIIHPIFFFTLRPRHFCRLGARAHGSLSIIEAANRGGICDCLGFCSYGLCRKGDRRRPNGKKQEKESGS